MSQRIPTDIWQAACGFAEQAVKVRVVYEDRAVYFIESCKRFLVASENAGVRELAELFIAKNVEEGFAAEFLNQSILMAAAQRERERNGEKFND